MGVYKAKEGKTKDGRVWFFRVRYQDMSGRNKQYKSGKFATKKEAEIAELEFRLKIHKHENMDDITIEEMIEGENKMDEIISEYSKIEMICIHEGFVESVKSKLPKEKIMPIHLYLTYEWLRA